MIMWDDLVKQKEKWIGGKLVDYGDSMDRRLLKEDAFPVETIVVDIEVTDEQIRIVGEDFSSGGSRKYIGITGSSQFGYPENGLVFRGYGGHEFHIIKPEPEVTA
jgi:hypothetical protein